MTDKVKVTVSVAMNAEGKWVAFGFSDKDMIHELLSILNNKESIGEKLVMRNIECELDKPQLASVGISECGAPMNWMDKKD